MNHQEAVRSQTAEKYVLGELRGGARDEFEDHFFECQECAEAVRTSVFLVDNAAAALQSAPARSAQAKTKAGSIPWKEWFRLNWFQPAFALPVLALVAVSGLWVRDHDELKSELSDATAPQAIGSVSLDVARGEKEISVVRDQRFFAVSFYLDADSLPKYAVEITGNGVTPATVVMAQRLNQRYNLLLPAARYRPGQYEFTVKGGPGTGGRVVQQFALNLQ